MAVAFQLGLGLVGLYLHHIKTRISTTGVVEKQKQVTSL